MNSFAKKYFFPKIFAKTCVCLVNDYADTVSAESTNTPTQCQRGQQLRGPDTVLALSMTTGKWIHVLRNIFAKIKSYAK